MDICCKINIFTIGLLIYLLGYGNCLSRFESVAPGMYPYLKQSKLTTYTDHEVELNKSLDSATRQLIQELKQKIIDFLDSEDSNEEKTDFLVKLTNLSKGKFNNFTIGVNLIKICSLILFPQRKKMKIYSYF